MDLVSEFEAHANECRRMARTTIDRESRASWIRMADRWVRLAESRKAAAAAPAERSAEKRRRPERDIYRRQARAA